MRPENPDPSPEALEARLRALPRPPVPAGLESRLLAAIPADRPTPRRRWAGWVGVAAAVAAACLLAVLAWPRREAKGPVPSPPPGDIVHQVAPRPPADVADLTAWRETRRVLDGAEMPPFTWPLPEPWSVRVSNAIPPDLLN
jgi:hypothetical protein